MTHGDLVVMRLSVAARFVKVMHARIERLPVERRFVERPLAESRALDDLDLRTLVRIGAHLLVDRVDLVLHGRVDELLFDPLANVERRVREKSAQAEPEQRKGDYQAKTKLTSGPHPDRPCDIRYRDACGSAASRKVCRWPHAARGCVRARSPNPAAPRPTRAARDPASSPRTGWPPSAPATASGRSG